MTGKRKVRLIMLNDVPHFWKKGDKRRVGVEFADTLVKAGWAKVVEDGTVKPEEKK